MKNYGKLLVLDLHDCNTKKFNRKEIGRYFDELCRLIKMEPCIRHWWDDVGVPKSERQTLPHTKGTSAVQFILTSSITIHTLDILRNAYIDIFSCKDFNDKKAAKFTENFFQGRIVQCLPIKRK